MIAKIGRGQNIYGVLSYNQKKVSKENGTIVLLNKMRETPDGIYSVNHLLKSFEPYLIANRNTEKPVMHISLNPDPGDNVTDKTYKSIARLYMQQMGYGEQPFVVFKHTDIERTHIHIVSVCIDEEGRKISDSFERKRSMNVCRALEQKYHLIPATEQKRENDRRIFQPVDYKKGNIKSQLAAVIRYLPTNYRFQSIGAYNALLSLFNITADQVNGELNCQPKHGLVYFALNIHGEKASNPFKSSLFGKAAGIKQLQKHFEKSKEQMKTDPARARLKNSIETAMRMTSSESMFKKQLLDQGIATVVRHNGEGRIYGITFIDHQSCSVWNGSQLEKNMSANIFSKLWYQSGEIIEKKFTPKIDIKTGSDQIPITKELDQKTGHPRDLFSFLVNQNPSESGLIEGLGGILPESGGEDYEEQLFEKQMKKKKKGKKII